MAKQAKSKRVAKSHAIISVSAKCSDLWSHTIIGSDGKPRAEYSGYVPSFMPGEHYGDYILLEINPYNGKILNWKPWKRAKRSKVRAK